MALFVYAPVIKQGTRELIEALGAKRLVRFDGLNFVHKGTPLKFNEAEDTIVCWGGCVPPLGKLRIFNSNLLFTNHIQMNEVLGRRDPIDGFRFLPIYTTIGAPEKDAFYFREQLQGYNVVPFDKTYGKAQYFQSSKLEYRMTVFDGEIIKTEKKIPLHKVHNGDFGVWVRGSGLSHSWYRTLDTGWEWRITKEKEKIENLTRTTLALAKTLELTFVVVTLGTNNNGLINSVRKINTTPNLDADGVQVYLNLIQTWIKKQGGSIVP